MTIKKIPEREHPVEDYAKIVLIVCTGAALGTAIWREVESFYEGCKWMPVSDRDSFDFWQDKYYRVHRVIVYAHTEWAYAGEFGGLKLVYEMLRYRDEQCVKTGEDGHAIQLNLVGFCNVHYIRSQASRLPDHCLAVASHFGCETLTMLQQAKMTAIRDPDDFADRRHKCCNRNVALAELIHDIRGSGKKLSKEAALRYINRLLAYRAVMNSRQQERFQALEMLAQKKPVPSVRSFVEHLTSFCNLKSSPFTTADEPEAPPGPPHVRAAIMEDDPSDMNRLKRLLGRWFQISDEHCLASSHNLDHTIAMLHEEKVRVVFIDMLLADLDGAYAGPQGASLFKRLLQERFIVRIISRSNFSEIWDSVKGYKVELKAGDMLTKTGDGFALSPKELEQWLTGILSEAMQKDNIGNELLSGEIQTTYAALTKALEFSDVSGSLNNCYLELRQNEPDAFKAMLSKVLERAASFNQDNKLDFHRTKLENFAKSHSRSHVLEITLVLRLVFLLEAWKSNDNTIEYYVRSSDKAFPKWTSTAFNDSFTNNFISGSIITKQIPEQPIKEPLNVLSKRLGLPALDISKVVPYGYGSIASLLKVSDEELYPHERAIRHFGLGAVRDYLAQ